MFFKKGVFKYFANFMEKHLCWSLFCIKLQAWISATLLKRNSMWRRGEVVITTAQLHSTKPELRFCAGSNPARGVSEIRDGEDLWQWSRLEIRLNTFRRSTIPQKQFIIIIIQHRCFPVKFAKFLRIPFFKEHLRWQFQFRKIFVIFERKT